MIEMVADEVCLIIRQSLPVPNCPIIYVGFKVKGILVGISLGEEFVRGSIKEMVKSQLDASLCLNSNRP